MVDAARSDHPATPHRVPPTRQQIIAQVLVSVVILVSGVIIGSGGTILALKDRIMPKFEGTGTSSQGPGRDVAEEERRSDFVARRIQGEYGLTDDQMRQIKAIFSQQFTASQELWKEFNAAEQKQQEKLGQAMKTILTADQFARWDSDFKKMVEHMQRMRPFDPRRGGRGGPPWDRGDGPPDLRMDPNNRRDGWRPGPPRDPNSPMMRGDRPRDGSRGPGSRRGDWGRDRPRDPNGMRDMGPRGLPPADANGPPPDMPRPQ